MKKYKFGTILFAFAMLFSCTKSREVHPELGDGNNEIITVCVQNAHVENQRSDFSELNGIVFNYGPSDGYGKAQYIDTANMVGKTDRFVLDLIDLECNTLYYYFYHLYYSNGEIVRTNQKSFRTLNSTDVPKNAIGGLFTVNEEGRKVFFSKGNVMHNNQTDTWSFAEQQYAFQADGNTNLFDWNMHNIIINTSCLGEQWRTLSGDVDGEWYYVLNCRSTLSDIRYAKAVVNNTKGIVLVPDDWDTGTYWLNDANTSGAQYSANVIRKSAWTDTLEPVGCVFLPAAGSADSLTFNNIGECGLYWSATAIDEEYSFGLTFGNDYLNSGMGRNWQKDKFSIRLVTDYITK